MVSWIAVFGVLVVCAGMGMVFTAYICMLRYTNFRVQSLPVISQEATDNHEEIKKAKGLSAAELERLPGLNDGGVVTGTECAVCLDDIETGQTARVLPECRHAFHQNCADAWLANNAVCPLCRAVPFSPN